MRKGAMKMSDEFGKFSLLFPIISLLISKNSHIFSMNKLLYLPLSLLLLTACGEKDKNYDATGTFEATEVTISAETTGQLQSWAVNEGDHVEAAKVLGHIDTYALQQKQSELEAAKQQVLLNAATADSRQLDLNKQLSALQQQIVNARSEQQRFAALVQDGAVPRKQLDDINHQIAVLQKQLVATREQLHSNNAALAEQSKAAKVQVRGVEAQQRQLADQLGKANITSPRDGVVLENYVEAGEFVSVGKPLFKLGDTRHMNLRAYVTTAQLKRVKIGQQVKVFADYGNGTKKEYHGRVTWISSRAEFTPKTIVTDDERADLVYAIKVGIQNDGYAKIGMYGEVKF